MRKYWSTETNDLYIRNFVHSSFSLQYILSVGFFCCSSSPSLTLCSIRAVFVCLSTHIFLFRSTILCIYLLSRFSVRAFVSARTFSSIRRGSAFFSNTIVAVSRARTQRQSLFAFEGEIGICSVRCCEDDQIEVTNAHLFERATHINIGSIVVLERLYDDALVPDRQRRRRRRRRKIESASYTSIQLHFLHQKHRVTFCSLQILSPSQPIRMKCVWHTHTRNVELRCQNNYQYFVASHFATLFMYSHDSFSLMFIYCWLYRIRCLLWRSNYQMNLPKCRLHSEFVLQVLKTFRSDIHSWDSKLRGEFLLLLNMSQTKHKKVQLTWKWRYDLYFV